MKLLEFRVVHAHMRIEYLRQSEHFARALVKRRRLTLPVVRVTALGSICCHTRNIGTKMRLRVNISITRPRTRGCWASDADRDDDVAHTTDRFAVRAEYNQAGKPGCKYLACCWP